MDGLWLDGHDNSDPAQYFKMNTTDATKILIDLVRQLQPSLKMTPSDHQVIAEAVKTLDIVTEIPKAIGPFEPLK
jgi:hypothetical protein